MNYEKLDHNQRIFLTKINNRIRPIYDELGIEYSRAEFDMDIIACHSNGCPLNFEKLAEADNFTFNHDIAGIRNNINRLTGELENHFLPRCAA